MILKVALSGDEFRKRQIKNRGYEELTAAILAGGQANRLGQSKIFIKYQNRPLITLVISLAKKLTPNVIFITRDLPIYFSHGIKTYKDIFWGKSLWRTKSRPHLLLIGSFSISVQMTIIFIATIG